MYGLSLLWFHRASVFLLTAPVVFMTMPLFSVNNTARRLAAFVIALLVLGCYAISVHAAWNWMVVFAKQPHFNAAVIVYPVLSLCYAFSQLLPELKNEETIGGDIAEQ